MPVHPLPRPDGEDPDRLRALEERLASLEARLEPARPAADSTAEDFPSPDPEVFWALQGLKERLGEAGGVLFTGAVSMGGGRYEYQWARPTEALAQADWAERSERVAALGHPLRLAILQRLTEGEHTVAQLVDELDLASTGVAYHHLSALQGGGWVASPRRGVWAIPVPRMIPLLTILLALEEG